METKPFAKALTKNTYQFGAPLKILALGLIPGLIIWLITFLIDGRGLWYFVLLELPWFLFIKIKLSRDEYWLDYLKDAFVQEAHLEP